MDERADGLRHCAVCEEDKPLRAFPKQQYVSKKTGKSTLYVSRCCHSCRDKQRPPARLEYLNKEENKLRAKQRSREHYIRNKEKILQDHKEWKVKNANRVTELNRAWGKTEKRKRYLRNKRKYDINYRLKCCLRARLGAYLLPLKQNSAIYEKTHVVELVGCSLEELKLWLEGLWEPGMSWENHGHRGWHIDHIIPCVNFDLSTIEGQKKCFHYTNLQPLWWKANLKKGAKCQINH